MKTLSNQELETVLRNSECLIDSGRINAAYDHLAAQLNLHYAGLNPLILVVMNGGLIPAGQLLTRLSFFHRMDYLHATRYRDNAASNDLVWKMRPTAAVAGEHIPLLPFFTHDSIFFKVSLLKKCSIRHASFSAFSVEIPKFVRKKLLMVSCLCLISRYFFLPSSVIMISP